MKEEVFTYNVPDKQTGHIPTWKASSGNVYKANLEDCACDGNELVCPVCKSCSYCGSCCNHCDKDFEEYLRLYYEAYGVPEEDILEGIKEWREKHEYTKKNT